MSTSLQQAASMVRKYGSGLTEIGGAYSKDKVKPTNQINEEGRFVSSDKTAGILKTKSKAAKKLRTSLPMGSVATKPRQY